MSLIFSPGSKGGSSISANLLDSLRTWIGKGRREQEKKHFFIQRLIFYSNFNCVCLVLFKVINYITYTALNQIIKTIMLACATCEVAVFLQNMYWVPTLYKVLHKTLRFLTDSCNSPVRVGIIILIS